LSLPNLETIHLRTVEHALFATLDVPQMNFVNAQLIRDLTALFEALDESDIRVAVFESAHPEFFLSRADVSDLPGYTAAASAAGSPADQWLGTLLRIISESRVVTIAKIAGRVGGAGSEFVLACDMRFASRERASFGQPEVAFGLTPGSGALQHLPRLMGRGRAMEVILGSDDYDADLAERYGWINRALPDAELDGFVEHLATRIAKFPPKVLRVAKERINQTSLPDIEEVYTDARWFQKFGRSPQMQARMATSVERGFNTDPEVEKRLGAFLGDLPAT
jgi:enoyl-CoA hydratase/carnithine racemase